MKVTHIPAADPDDIRAELPRHLRFIDYRRHWGKSVWDRTAYTGTVRPLFQPTPPDFSRDGENGLSD